MRFVFEVMSEPNHLSPSGWIHVRALMAAFEVMVNTTFPCVRVHLREDNHSKTKQTVTYSKKEFWTR